MSATSLAYFRASPVNRPGLLNVGPLTFGFAGEGGASGPVGTSSCRIRSPGIGSSLSRGDVSNVGPVAEEGNPVNGAALYIGIVLDTGVECSWP